MQREFFFPSCYFLKVSGLTEKKKGEERVVF